MKKLICIVSALILMAFSCRKEPEQMTVLRDCTGVYLRLDNKDYHVCNPEKVSSFPDGAVVTASFKRVNECNGSAKDSIVCMIVRENEGWIEVEEIK